MVSCRVWKECFIGWDVVIGCTFFVVMDREKVINMDEVD